MRKGNKKFQPNAALSLKNSRFLASRITQNLLIFIINPAIGVPSNLEKRLPEWVNEPSFPPDPSRG